MFANEPPRVHVEVLDPDGPAEAGRRSRQLGVPASAGPSSRRRRSIPKGSTFLDAVMLGVGDALRADPRVFVYGEDVGGAYGNAFLLLRPLLKEFGDRIINSPLAEGAVLGVCVGAALAGQRPIGEIQFNDFVATGFNQLVNNAAKIRYRWGGDVPMVVRMPWGGLRHAGPYHSQNTEPWFYRTAGPEDRRAVDAARRARADGVGGRRSRSGALLRAHRALSRSAHQAGCSPTRRRRRFRSARRRCGAPATTSRSSRTAPTSTSRCASPRSWRRTASRRASSTCARSCRSIATRCSRVARRCHKVLIIHEDSRTGGIGESLAAIIQEEAFESLDAPVRIVGALDTPVPYSPPLEEFYLPSEAQIERAARLLRRLLIVAGVETETTERTGSTRRNGATERSCDRRLAEPAVTWTKQEAQMQTIAISAFAFEAPCFVQAARFAGRSHTLCVSVPLFLRL